MMRIVELTTKPCAPAGVRVCSAKHDDLVVEAEAATAPHFFTPCRAFLSSLPYSKNLLKKLDTAECLCILLL
jgi:hypothetical protein